MRCYATLHGHERSISSIALSPDGAILASGGADGTVWLWSVPEGSLLATPSGDGSDHRCLAFAPDGRILFSAGAGGEVWVWSIPDGRPLTRLASGDFQVHSLGISPDGTLLVAGCSSSLCLWLLPAVGLPPRRITPVHARGPPSFGSRMPGDQPGR
jgi:WD40 repeat protein